MTNPCNKEREIAEIGTKVDIILKSLEDFKEEFKTIKQDIKFVTTKVNKAEGAYSFSTKAIGIAIAAIGLSLTTLTKVF